MTTYKQSSLDELMILTALGLQLPQSKRELAEQRYHSVGHFLERPESPFREANIDIYPQGSMAIGTTVKPLTQEEYDIDLVLQMDWTPFHDNPIMLLDELEAYLKSSGNYVDIVERRNRCVCLNYSGDFHLDIIPATPDSLKRTCNTCVVVPDRELRDWSPSNPLGFASWFTQRAFEKHHQMMFAECRIHPVPGEEPINQKPPLKRVVQLLKRHRDIFFNGGKKTPSIIITTLAGQASQRLGEKQYSVADLFYNVLVFIKNEIETAKPAQIEVTNPTNPHEIFSEKWEKHPERYRMFVLWIDSALADIQELCRAQSREEAIEILGKMFGVSQIREAVRTYAAAMREASNRGSLKVASGIGIVSSSPAARNTQSVKPHTFYGDSIFRSLGK
jgi:hypothetical protein